MYISTIKQKSVIMAGAKFLVLCLFFVKSKALFEGDDCVLLDAPGGAGKCTDIQKCDYAKKLLKSNKIPQQCGFKRNSPIICCPVDYEASTKRKSKEKCEEYYNLRNLRTGIAHGKKAISGEFPHMAAIGFDNNGHIMWLCGGSLISERFVLTAAHCTKTRNPDMATPKWVRLGDLDLNDTSDDAPAKNVRIKTILPHPGYKPPSRYDDIALLELAKRVRFGRYIKPACLHTKTEIPSKLQVTGWGKTDFFGETSSHLMKATVNVISQNVCSERYATISTRQLGKGIVDQMICAGDDIGKDTCPGDSGGPLHFYDRSNPDLIAHFVVAGVTSFGKACGLENSVGVYTRISAYALWIEDIVWP